jgi:hypothetical protein
MSTVRYTSFPHTKPPPSFVPKVVEIFRSHEPKISTQALAKGLESDPVLRMLADDLATLGFSVEGGKARGKNFATCVLRTERSAKVDIRD